MLSRAEAIAFYRGRTLKWFAGTPIIRRDLAKLKIGPLIFGNFERSDWRGYVLAIAPFAAEVFHNGERIAAHGWQLDTSLWVHHEHRGKELATQLVVECALRYPGQRHSAKRSPGGHRVYVKAWHQLEAMA